MATTAENVHSEDRTDVVQQEIATFRLGHNIAYLFEQQLKDLAVLGLLYSLGAVQPKSHSI